MPKSRFRILGFRCLKMKPNEYSFGNNEYYVKRIQKAHYGNNDWMMFYQSVTADKSNTNKITISNTLFDDELISDNEGMCVAICAIVGKNGCGKSTIIDNVIRILNNAAASLIGEDFIYLSAQHLHYIENVHGAILYIQDDELFQLVVDGHEVRIINYSRTEMLDSSCYIENDRPVIFLQSPSCREEYLLPLKSKELSKLSSLFYSIVINYSLYAFYYNDYYQEATNETKLKKLKYKPDLSKYPFEQLWMTGLFHKNDGYQTPVVINPMRQGGVINAPKENRLAKERILSLLFVESKDKQEKKGVYRYPFRTINGNLRIMALSLPTQDDIHSLWTKEWMVKQKYFGKKSRLYTNYETYHNYIITYFKEYYSIDETVSNFADAERYLVYKIIKIGLSYLNYSCIISNLRHKDFSLERLHQHLDRLIQDDSHITAKLRRVLLYLIYGNDIYGESQDSQHRSVYRLCDIEPKIENALSDFNRVNPPFVAKRDDFLPPPIFDINFRMVKNGTKDWDEVYTDNDLIPFEGLSSGERQVAYTISNFAYHLVNVNSVWKSNTSKIGKVPLLKYKYVNAIFDEIEMYYHPELQRTFISLVLDTLRDVELENIEGVNIILVTHSPFVLSDIPRSNILALGNEPSNDETFCANIHEMLSQSFFMQYSMGEVARKSVEELFDTYRNFYDSADKSKYLSNISSNKIKKYEYLVQKIADEYLKKTAKGMVEEMKSFYVEKDTLATIEKKIENSKRELEELVMRKQELMS